MANLVDPSPVLLVVPQHAGPQHVHHLWKLLIHEGGSDYRHSHRIEAMRGQIAFRNKRF